MFVPILTPEDFVRIAKRETVVKAWITLGRRKLMVQTVKKLYADEVVAYSLNKYGKIVVVLKCGVVLATDYYIQGRTVFLENIERVDDVIVM